MTYPLDRNRFPDGMVRPFDHHDHAPKKITRGSPFDKVSSSSEWNFLFKQIVNYIRCGFVNPAAPPKSAPSSYHPTSSSYHPTPFPCTITHPTPLQLMELNKKFLSSLRHNGWLHWVQAQQHWVEICGLLWDCFSASSGKDSITSAFSPQCGLEGAHSHNFSLGVQKYPLE